MNNMKKSTYVTSLLLLVFGVLLGILGLQPLFRTAPIAANPEPSDALTILIEKDRIIETVNHLFIGTDQRDWAMVKDVFAPQVLFDMTSLAGGEPATLSSQAIVDSWEQGLQSLQAIHHQVGNYLVTVNGHEADVFCYGIASHYLPNPTNQNTRVFVGSYNFHLVKDGEQWRIDQFKFNLKYVDGNPNLEGK